MELKLELFAKVKFYPYRSARVDGIFFEIDRDCEAARKFENELAKRAGRNIDNHTAYAIINTSGKTLYVRCSDSCMAFGSELEERHW